MADEARRGLAWRAEFNRGGTRVGATRARQILRKDNLSLETVKRMRSYFARHEVDKMAQGFRRGEKGYPSAGRIAWALWGGDAGQDWANKIVEKYGTKKMSTTTLEPLAETKSLRTFSAIATASRIDAEAGTLRDVTIIEQGEAKGHGILITNRTMLAAGEILVSKSIPAYITHSEARDDRLGKEIGYFSGFYLEHGAADSLKLKATQFKAFESFRKYNAESYERLFELAETIPDQFGISIVFEAELFWETSEGDAPFSGFDSRPENATFEKPTVSILEVKSADFVDNPAATNSLFTKQNQNPVIPMIETNQVELKSSGEQMGEISDSLETADIALTTAASDELEKSRAAESQPEAKAEPKPAAEKPKKKKKLNADPDPEDEDEAAEADAPEGEAAESEGEAGEEAPALEAQQEIIDELEQKVAGLSQELKSLRAIVDGSEPIEVDDTNEEMVEPTQQEMKAAAVAELMGEKPHMTKAQALLEIGKRKPELF